jgi:hypothetical protein
MACAVILNKNVLAKPMKNTVCASYLEVEKAANALITNAPPL